MARKKKTKKPKQPKLRPDTKAWMEATQKLYVMQSHQIRILLLAAFAWDRGTAAREEIAAKGISFVDRFSNIKIQPSIKVESDSAALFARLIKDLNFSIPNPDDIHFGGLPND